jgi:hypothetical protein
VCVSREDDHGALSHLNRASVSGVREAQGHMLVVIRRSKLEAPACDGAWEATSEAPHPVSCPRACWTTEDTSKQAQRRQDGGGGWREMVAYRVEPNSIMKWSCSGRVAGSSQVQRSAAQKSGGGSFSRMPAVRTRVQSHVRCAQGGWREQGREGPRAHRVFCPRGRGSEAQRTWLWAACCTGPGISRPERCLPL